LNSLLYALPWLAPPLAAVPLARRSPDLATYPPADDGLITVIIPARNEAGAIATVVRSILASTYPSLEVIVVDDRSTDDTAAIVRGLIDEELRSRPGGAPRLGLVAGSELPDGWYGKPWACEQGYRAARGEILVFTDADTRHHPALLGHAVGALLAERPGLLTLVPHQVTVTWWERLVMPQFMVLLGLRFPPGRINRARRARDVLANGQFILLRRATYEALGTHAAVRGEVAEDLALAQRAFTGGHRVWVAFAEDLMATRMYDGLRSMVEGWSKNVYLGGRRSFPDQPVLRALVPVITALPLLFWLAPPVMALLAPLVAPALLLPALAATAVSIAFWSAVARRMRIPVVCGPGYPLGALVALFIVMRSTWRGRRRVEWKGRTYAEDARGRLAAAETPT
jgi:chlorobactene glucosyltransferase